MTETRDIIVVGGFHEIIELCEVCNRHIVGIIDQHLKGNYFGYKVFGGDECSVLVYEQYGDIPLVVTPDMPQKRKKLVERYSKIGFRFSTLVHPSALISRSAIIGNGVIIQAGAHVSAAVKICDFVRVNVFANLMHDVSVEKYVTIAPNAVVLGKVTIGESSYIGSNSTILPDIKVGAKSVVGAGSVVTKDVGENVVFMGNPAKDKGRSK